MLRHFELYQSKFLKQSSSYRAKFDPSWEILKLVRVSGEFELADSKRLKVGSIQGKSQFVGVSEIFL